MTLRLNGSTSGYTEIDAPAAAGSNTLILPTSNGAAGNILGTDGSGNLSWVNGRMVQGIAQASTSGTSIDFTSIPSWVKRVTVMFHGVSTNGTSNVMIQLGTSGGFQTTSYGGSCFSGAGTTANVSMSSGFLVTPTNVAAASLSGMSTIALVSSNSYVENAVIGRSDGATIGYMSGGTVTLSGTLDRIRITTVNGTDAFDAGTINILYEG